MTSQELKEQIMAFAPLLTSIVLIVNTFLSAKGLPCLGITDTDVTTLVSGIASAAAVIWTWWTNNNVTPYAQVAQEVLNALKSGLISTQDVLDFLQTKLNQPVPETEVPGFTEQEADEIVERVDELDNSDPSEDQTIEDDNQ